MRLWGIMLGRFKISDTFYSRAKLSRAEREIISRSRVTRPDDPHNGAHASLQPTQMGTHTYERAYTDVETTRLGRLFLKADKI